MTKANDLTAIRQAHRYIVAYQRRLIDALSVFNSKMLEIGFNFDEWDPIHFERPPKKSNVKVFQRWAFDFLMLYSVGFYWERGEENKQGNIYFWLEHLADTGLERVISESSGEPDSLKFQDAEDSDSILRCCWIAITGKESPFSSDEWDENEFDELLENHFDRDCIGEFGKIVEPLPLTEFKKKGVIFGQMAMSLENFPDPESFYQQFCDVIITHLKELSGIS